MPTWVEHIQQVGVRGILTGQSRQQGAIESLEVELGPGDRRWYPARFLRALSSEEPDEGSSIFTPLANRRFSGCDVLRRLMTHEKLRGTLSEVIYSMEAAQIDFYPYQFKPVLKFVESPVDRLILADEVGLGKTIEAALIWLELKARRQARRLLVVCTKMLAEKWRKELKEKFEIDAQIADFSMLSEGVHAVEKEGASHQFALITTYTGLKPAKRDAHRLDSTDDEVLGAFPPKAVLLRKLRQWGFSHAPFDLVIFDEAHAMRNQETAAFRLGESLAVNAGSVLCVSATPLATSNNDLRTLLRLIDPDFFSNAWVFDSMLAENRPAVRASNLLGQVPPDVKGAAAALRKLDNSQYLGGSELLKQAHEQIENLSPQDRPGLAKLQDSVERLNILGAYVTRTRRVQVEEMRSVREPKIIPVDYTSPERALYDGILAFVRERAAMHGRNFHFFEVIGWQLRAASCLPAVAEKIRAHSREMDDDMVEEVFGSLETMEPDEEGDEVDDAAPEGWTALANLDFERCDSKFTALLRLLKGDLKADKCVMFSFYRGTLAYLERRLMAAGIRTATIHGGVKQEDRNAIIEKFATDPSIHVLLSSEVGSEGIDLQFCSVVINYDLPWNPMRIEQRIGRIDRVGQKAEKLRVVHFKIKDTVEERLFDRLHSRLELFRNSLGDLDAVLGEEIQKLTKDIFSKKLTPEQEVKRIEQTAQVIEKKHHTLDELESRGEGLVAMADYLQKKIRGSRGLGRYVTSEELEESVRDFFSRNYNGTELRWDDPVRHCFRIKLSFEAQSDLAQFLRADRSFSATRLRQRDFAVCFRPDVLRELDPPIRKNILFINHLSPLIRWITNANGSNSELFHRVSASTLNDSELPPGVWLFLVRRWSFFGGLSVQRMAYAAIAPGIDQELTGTEAEKLALRVLREGRPWTYPEFEISDIQTRYQRATRLLDEEKAATFDQFHAENANYVQIRIRRTEAYSERRIEQARERIATARSRGMKDSALRGFEGMLRAEEDSARTRIRQLKRHADASSEETDVALGLILVER